MATAFEDVSQQFHLSCQRKKKKKLVCYEKGGHSKRHPWSNPEGYLEIPRIIQVAIGQQYKPVMSIDDTEVSEQSY